MGDISLLRAISLLGATPPSPVPAAPSGKGVKLLTRMLDFIGVGLPFAFSTYVWAGAGLGWGEALTTKGWAASAGGGGALPIVGWAKGWAASAGGGGGLPIVDSWAARVGGGEALPIVGWASGAFTA